MAETGKNIKYIFILALLLKGFALLDITCQIGIVILKSG